MEALRDAQIQPYKLHLADSNKEEGTMAEILTIAQKKQIPLLRHSRMQLSRISKNGKQDQGVALDIRLSCLQQAQTLNKTMHKKPLRLLALDNVTNPQNVGLIIRSVCAGGMNGIILPKRGCARLDALVIKASAGTFFRTPLFLCDSLAQCLSSLQTDGAELCLMQANAKQSLFAFQKIYKNIQKTVIYVLGNETEGVSKTVAAIRHTSIFIPMHNGVESLNVAMAATLIAYC